MVIRQAAFEKPGVFLKGALHCHTVLSDGQAAPDAVLRHHAAMGYDFVAITDHRRYNFQNFAPDTGLLLLPGMEADRYLDGCGMPVAHIVAVGPERGNGYADGQQVLYEKGGTAADCQDMLDDIAANNNLAIWAHPAWSGNSVEELKRLHGFNLLEIWNTGTELIWGFSDLGFYWDPLLHEGRRIYGVASDDGHSLQENGFGFVRVKAEKTVDSVLQALQNGEFYASCGPEIYDFYVEDGYACITCSPVERIILRNYTAPHRQLVCSGMTGGQIKIRDCCTDYVRMEVVDAQGRRAWTNPIFF